ncbi:flagellar basal-body MS-ring/collar protein FliF [Alkaliphilus hydrothermalis]|uniref:Flagellar M-ring protein n=1 Tax=Alkaliphilus hydrothermalis TaxID=1482730 RepID=A0ABS2NL49_9FIRM|nr:flagellar basal-body MS-ring/collar protein FliF [Alkaliphilus hydrothermalis]MBM7613654.1 flagellar M-ring protein FliF [Alkaliphilus hydrothermalis]
MPEALQKISGQLNDYFQGMEKKQKMQMFFSGVFILLTLTGLIFFFTRVEYVPLYTNLDPKHSGEILNVLTSNNIEAKLGEASSTIMVNEKDMQRAQVVVATEGLPSARFGYEEALTNSSSFMMTSEERSQRFLIAQQNHLAQTIEEISGVNRAVVNLSVPEKTGFVFNNNQQPSKASVYLDLSPVTKLDNNSINGIAVLVSNAVEGLDVENVTIHGNDGRVLNPKNTEDGAFGVNDQLNLNNVIKQELEISISDFLSTVYGYGNIAVMANVRLDFDSEVTEIKEFSPPIEGETNGIVRSMQKLQSSSVNSSTGGVPGTDPNTETPQYVEADQSEAKYEEANETINYEINELRKKIVKAQGQVRDITVAVYINSSSLNNGDLSDSEKKELINIISAAAGLDTKVVQVGIKEFNNSLPPHVQDAFNTVESRGLRDLPLGLIGVLAAVVMGAAFFAVAQIRKKKKVELPPVIETITPEEYEDIDLELSGSQVKQQIEKLVAKKPEAVAQLLRNWLSEE